MWDVRYDFRAWLRRVTSWFGALLRLSVEGRGLFYLLVTVHVLMKVLLGLRMAQKDGYGLVSFMAPPMSVLFAASDVLVSFGIARLVDLVRSPRIRSFVQIGLLPLLWCLLTTDFILHGYFKMFLNRGLLEFNGASSLEIADYTRAGTDGYTIAFVLGMSTLFLGFIAARQRLHQQSFVRRTPRVPGGLTLASIGILVFLGTLSAGQSGWLRPDPVFALAYSYAVSGARGATTATDAEVAAFHEPQKLLYGTADTTLDVEVPPSPGANVLFVLIESLPLEETSLGGAANLPVLQDLAQDGVSFENFRTVFPATSRSFLTYHCGTYPTTGSATATKYVPSFRCQSLLAALRGANYRTGFFTAPMFTYDNLHHSAIAEEYDVYKDMAVLRAGARMNTFDAPAVEEEAVSKNVLQFMDETRGQPFFATYFMFWNHAPYRLPFEDIGSLSPRERYRRCLAYLDKVLRDLLTQARERGLLDNTIIVVAADHGEGFGEYHGDVNHVGHIYENDVRVPLLIHVPRLGPHRTARPVSNVDFAPTMARLLGLPASSSWQGQDMLAPEFTAKPIAMFGRASVSTDGLLDGNWKYITYPDAGHTHLFDLARDPHEQHDVAGAHPTQVAAYGALLQTWLPVMEAKAWRIHEETAAR